MQSDLINNSLASVWVLIQQAINALRGRTSDYVRDHYGTSPVSHYFQVMCTFITCTATRKVSNWFIELIAK